MSNLYELIKGERERHPKIWRKIADFILSDPERALGMKLREFSTVAGVSEGSVINFVRSLGYDGFVEFKVAMAQTGGFNTRYASEGGVFDKIASFCKLAFDDAVKSVSDTEIEKIAERLTSPRARVIICGKGSSAHIAAIFAGYLVRLGIAAFAPDDFELSARALSEGDVLVAVTYSGATSEVLSAIEAARERGAFTVALTSFESSKIARAAESVILMRLSEAEDGEFPLIARVVELAVCDAICSKVIAIKNGNIY